MPESPSSSQGQSAAEAARSVMVSSRSAAADRAVSPCPDSTASPAEASEPAQPANETLVQVPAAVSHTEQKKEEEKKKTWIEIILVDEDGKPVPGVRYRITPPGGEPVEGVLNEHGQAGVYQIDPGNCKVTFPDLDKEAWI